MIHFHLIFKYSFFKHLSTVAYRFYLTFRYNIFEFNNYGFYLRGSKHGAVFMFKLCILLYFKRLTIINILIRIKTDS